jgi:outer membrane protein OmpA-like peptidoglycan-associated protein
VGPTGRTGSTGEAGAEGRAGFTGAQGVNVAGLTGDTGPSGFQGVQGRAGEIGAQGAVGIVANWTPYRTFHFNRADTSLTPSEMETASSIAGYMRDNPSLDIAIDGSMNNARFNQSDRSLGNQRANFVRTALLQAGVPAYKIQMGAYANPAERQPGRIEVLLKTRN